MNSPGSAQPFSGPSIAPHVMNDPRPQAAVAPLKLEHSAAGGYLAVGGEQHDPPRVVRHAEDENLGGEARDPAGPGSSPPRPDGPQRASGSRDASARALDAGTSPKLVKGIVCWRFRLDVSVFMRPANQVANRNHAVSILRTRQSPRAAVLRSVRQHVDSAPAA